METKEQFSCCNNDKETWRCILNRLQQTDNQKALYTLRLISKSEQERVEKKIQTAKINFCDIEKFATSQFSARIKFLKVSLRKGQDCFEYDSFKYLSNTYLPYALNIYAKVYPSFSHKEKTQYFIRLGMREPLIFGRLHIVNQSKLCFIQITGKYNVQIRDCEFIGIGVYSQGNANVYVTGSKFIKGENGLAIYECDSLYIDEISFDNCSYNGLVVELVKEVINIANVCVFSCPSNGIFIGQNVAKFKLSSTIIKDCTLGILVYGSCCGQIQKTNIEGCEECGIYIYRGAIVHYAAVEFKHNRQDVGILDDVSQFLQLENIQ